MSKETIAFRLVNRRPNLSVSFMQLILGFILPHNKQISFEILQTYFRHDKNALKFIIGLIYPVTFERLGSFVGITAVCCHLLLFVFCSSFFLPTKQLEIKKKKGVNGRTTFTSRNF